ncbi:SdpI family protein [Corynebacterium urogenitale]
MYGSILGAIFLVAGVLCVVVGVKATKGTLNRNFWLGPDRRTMDEEAWVRGHKVAGPWFIAAGAGSALCSAACFFGDDSMVTAACMASVVVLVMPTAIGSMKANKVIKEAGE